MHRRLYWTDDYDKAVFRGSLNGVDRQTLFIFPGRTDSIFTDIDGGKIYWSSFFTGIFSADLNGGNIQQIYTTSSSVRGIALQFSPKIYWLENTSTTEGKLRSADFDGAGVEDFGECA